MFGRRRRRGLGLGGILVIIGLLYFTGAGKWLWERMMQLEGQCYSMLAQMGTSAGSPVCSGAGSVIGGLDQFFSNIGGSISSMVDSVQSMFAGNADFDSVVGEFHLTSALEKLGSTQEQLAQRLRMGPQSLSISGNVGEQVRSAVDSFNIGSRYMGGDGSSSYRAIPWLQQGARVPGYGVMSQLSLGDMYRSGNSSMSASPQTAIQYYSQAHQSIGILQQSNTPEAQRMLSALPASPAQMQQQLLNTIRELKASAR